MEQTSNVHYHTVKEGESETRFDRWCQKNLPDLPFGQMQKLIRSGQFRIDGKRTKPHQKLITGQKIRIPPNAGSKPQSYNPNIAKIDEQNRAMIIDSVLFDDKDLIVINKPPGLAVQGGSKTDRHLDGMLDALAKKGERPKLVHRLDKDTSGVLLLARHAKIAKELMHTFQSHNVEKLYWAIVQGKPDRDKGLIDLAIGKAGGQGFEKMTPNSPEAKRAKTDFRVIARAGKVATFVGMMPLTGRTHQLRAHMEAIGNPIIGDRKYGAEPMTGSPKGLMLHAREIAIRSLGLNVKAPVPKSFAECQKWLAFSKERQLFDQIEDWTADAEG